MRLTFLGNTLDEWPMKENDKLTYGNGTQFVSKGKLPSSGLALPPLNHPCHPEGAAVRLPRK